MNNKEFINKGLDPEMAKYKLPIDFEGMIGFWSDLDGYQIYDYKSLITIEEKAFWGAGETGAKFNNRWLVDNSKAPAIVFYTSSSRDHVAEGDTVVKLKNSIVVDFHTNDERFKFFIAETGVELSTNLLVNGKPIVEAVQIWKDFINKTGYWKNDPRL